MRAPPLSNSCAVSSAAKCEGLTWLKENLDLRLPRVSPDILKLSAVSITELASPICAAEGYHACAGCRGRGQREACVKDVNIDPIVVLPHK